MNRLLPLLVLIATGLLAQNAPQGVTGSVSGRVFDADTNLPLADVKLHAVVDRMAGTPATTDAQGRYRFEHLPPGNRSIEVYDGNLGPSSTAPQTVTVIGGRDVQADFHTRLFGQVSGRVLDDEGNPIAGMQVTANWKEYDGGGFDGHRSHTGELKMVSVLARALTDDQGRYVITTIPAGLQYRIAAYHPKRNGPAQSDSPADPQARRRTLAATYYPNSNSFDAAPSLVVHSQEVRDGVDIRMLKTESYCLEATLTAGGVPSQMQFLLIESEVANTQLPSVNLPGSSMSSSDGRIRLCDLYPGQFRLIAARLSSVSQESIGAADFTITNKDVRDLVVAAIPPTNVSAEVLWDKKPMEASIPSIRVRMYPSPRRTDLTIPVPGTSSIDVVAGSSYLTDISGLDSHSYVKDVQYDGASILNRYFVPSGGDAKMRITIGSDAGSITATVLNANGQPAAGATVLIVPATARSEPEVAATFHAGYTDETGTYSDRGLPPGKYDVFATNDPPPNRIDRNQIMLVTRTPEAASKIMRARARGKPVDVGSGGGASVMLVPFRLD
jgi:hypothetical protein